MIADEVVISQSKGYSMVMNTIERFAYNDAQLRELDYNAIAYDMQWTLLYDKSFAEINWEMLDEFSELLLVWRDNDKSYLPQMILQDLKEWTLDHYDWKSHMELVEEMASDEHGEQLYG